MTSLLYVCDLCRIIHPLTRFFNIYFKQKIYHFIFLETLPRFLHFQKKYICKNKNTIGGGEFFAKFRKMQIAGNGPLIVVDVFHGFPVGSASFGVLRGFIWHLITSHKIYYVKSRVRGNGRCLYCISLSLLLVMNFEKCNVNNLSIIFWIYVNISGYQITDRKFRGYEKRDPEKETVGDRTGRIFLGNR